MRAEKSVGRAMASSSALVCSDWVWPRVAAMASMQVRAMLLNGSCSVSDQPEVCEWVRRASDFGFFGSKVLTIFAQSMRAARIFATSMKWFFPCAQKNERRGREGVDVDARGDAGAEVFPAVGEGVGHFEVGGGAGFLHVIAGDRDRVELRHVLRGELEDVGDDPHRGRGRIDIGVPHHVFLEDVVLDRAGELVERGALFERGDDVEGEHGKHRAVHGHGDGDLVERDAVEEDLHVEDRVDGDAGLADIADDALVVRVVAAVGGEVEGDGEALLAGGEVAAVEGVGFLGGGESGVLADGPWLEAIHRGVGAAEEGGDAGLIVQVFHALEVVLGVERLDRDFLHGVPDDLADGLAVFFFKGGAPLVVAGFGRRGGVGDVCE